MRQPRFRTLWRGLAAACLALATLLAWPALSQDDDGPDLLTRTLQNLLSDAGREVRIVGFEGALSSQATIRELTIADDDGPWIVLSGVVLNWNRGALLEGVVDVTELSAQTIELRRMPGSGPNDGLPSPTARAPFSLPDLPVSVQIGRIGAGRVSVDATVLGQPAELAVEGRLTLSGGAGDGALVATRTDGQPGQMRFVGGFDNLTRVLDLDLSLSEGAGGIAATLLGIPERPALTLSVAGNGPLATFEADIGLATDGVERVSGQLRLIDDSPQSSLLVGGGFALDVSGDLRPLMVASLHPFFGAESRLRATGQRSEQGDIRLPDLTISANSVTLTGSAEFAPSGLPRLVALNAEIAHPDAAPVVLPGTQGAAQLSRASLSIDYDSTQSRDWSLIAAMEGLNLPSVEIGDANLIGRGRLGVVSEASAGQEPPLFEGVLEFLFNDIAAPDPAVQTAIGSNVAGLVSLAWPGPDQPVEISGIGIDGETVSLTAFGTLDGLDFDGFVEFAAPDLTAFAGLAGRPLAGSALVSMQGRANAFTGALDLDADLVTTDLHLDIAEADALLAGDAGIALSLVRDTEGTRLRSFALEAGTLSVTADGTIGPASADLLAHLAISDLARLGEGYGGSVFTDLQIEQRGADTRFRADGATIDLALGGLPGGDVLTALLTGANRIQLDATNTPQGLSVAALTLEGPALSIAGAGSLAPADSDFTLRIARLDLAAAAPGGQGVVTGLASIAGPESGRLYRVALAGEGPLRTGTPLFDGLVGAGLSVDAQARGLTDGTLLLESARIDAAGLTLDARGALEGDGGQRIRLDARFPDLTRFHPVVVGALSLGADIRRAAGQTRYDIDANAEGPSQFRASVTGSLAGLNDATLGFSAQIDGSAFNTLVEPANVAGLIRAQGRLDGPLALDSLRATLTASDARYALPPANVAFDQIALNASVTGAQANLSLTGRSLNGGTGEITGRVPLAPGQPAALRVTVRDFVVRNPQLFEARVDGQFAVNGVLNRGPLVSGSVQVAQAEIRIPAGALGRAGTVPTGLRHIGESAASRATRDAAGIARGERGGSRGPVPLRLDLLLEAPGRVFVRGRGLDAELGGTLRLGGTTRAVVPSGQFSLIRGRLDLLGNRFVLTEGSASMIGSFVPFVSLTATTDSDGVLTALTLSGRANEPEISFSSVPDLPDDEILARLVFGRALQDLSPFQAAQLALSVATLTGRADNSILSRTRDALGLDDLDFTVDDAGNTALRAGRYLNENVYTDLSVDTEGRGEVSINLDLTETIRLRGSADSEGGSSLGIFFERDY